MRPRATSVCALAKRAPGTSRLSDATRARFRIEGRDEGRVCPSAPREPASGRPAATAARAALRRRPRAASPRRGPRPWRGGDRRQGDAPGNRWDGPRSRSGRSRFGAKTVARPLSASRASTESGSSRPGEVEEVVELTEGRAVGQTGAGGRQVDAAAGQPELLGQLLTPRRVLLLGELEARPVEEALLGGPGPEGADGDEERPGRARAISGHGFYWRPNSLCAEALDAVADRGRLLELEGLGRGCASPSPGP